MKWAKLVELGRELPEVDVGMWYGTPSLHVRGKSFVRQKDEHGLIAVFVVDSVPKQEWLIETQPDVYFITDHYRGYAAVLARMPTLRVAEARARLAEGWRLKAPGSLRKDHPDLA